MLPPAAAPSVAKEYRRKAPSDRDEQPLHSLRCTTVAGLQRAVPNLSSRGLMAWFERLPDGVPPQGKLLEAGAMLGADDELECGRDAAVRSLSSFPLMIGRDLEIGEDLHGQCCIGWYELPPPGAPQEGAVRARGPGSRGGGGGGGGRGGLVESRPAACSDVA